MVELHVRAHRRPVACRVTLLTVERERPVRILLRNGGRNHKERQKSTQQNA
jgi:hypothetical protein